MIVITSLITNSILRNIWPECTSNIFIDVFLLRSNKSYIDKELNSLMIAGGQGSAHQNKVK